MFMIDSNNLFEITVYRSILNLVVWASRCELNFSMRRRVGWIFPMTDPWE